MKEDLLKQYNQNLNLNNLENGQSDCGEEIEDGKKRILVVDAHTKQMVYCNKEGENQEIIQGTCEECGYFLSFQHILIFSYRAYVYA